MKNYILNNGKVEPCEDINKWSAWMSNANRTIIQTEREGILVSTVFLGVDYGIDSKENPIIFETMVFNDIENNFNESFCERTATIEEAKDVHIKACKKTFKSYTKDDLFLDLL